MNEGFNARKFETTIFLLGDVAARLWVLRQFNGHTPQVAKLLEEAEKLARDTGDMGCEVLAEYWNSKRQNEETS
jgi:hypothetical protein